VKINYNCTLLITILICSSLQSLQAQFGYLPAGRQVKISNSIDLILGADFGFRTIDKQNASQAATKEYQNRNELETYKMNYRFGLNYIHGVSKTLSIKTGIRLSNPGFSVQGIEDIDLNQSINTIEKQISTNQEGSVFHYGYQLVEIPLGLRYTLTKNSCEPFFELGISTNLYWRTIVRRQKFNQRGYSRAIIKEDEINKLNYVGFLSMGGNINLSRNFSAFTQLIARYQLNNLRKGKLVEKTFGLGLEFGVRRYI